jgi:hypothetical protein
MRSLPAATLFTIVASVSVAAQATTPSAAQAARPQPAANPLVVKGCLAPGAVPNAFTLTTTAELSQPSQPAPTGTSGTKPVAKTIVYTLQPGANVDLAPHVGHQVEITGTDTGGSAEATASQSTPATTAPGARTTDAKPMVKTSETTDIVAKTLNVTGVKMIAASCDVPK